MITIREIEYDDIDKGFLEVLENLLSTDIANKTAKNILKKIKSNPFHKIFVAYIEDVSVRKGYEGLGIGFKLVTYTTNYAISNQDCKKILLYCSEKNRPFYEKLGYKLSDDTSVMKFES